jgi:DNA-binding NtrC family response regulator
MESLASEEAPRGAEVLVVDDDPVLLGLVERTLAKEGYGVRTAASAEAAAEALSLRPPDLVVSDLLLPGEDGAWLLQKVKSAHPECEVILITAHATIERAVEAMRMGAYDFVQKPIQRDGLLRAVARALERRELAAENRRLRERLAEGEAGERLVGASLALVEIKRKLVQIAATQMPVLVVGESGTGKEVVADVIHELSPRRRRRLVKISCAAIPETLLESELFGYERGAFSGAAQAKAGRLELAHGGTLFLDEIGEMAPPMQAKLLRVLQDGRVQRLGSTKETQIDVRIVAATNADLEDALAAKRFREDLYHRLAVFEIRLPPLTERPEDIPVLARHFLRKHRGIRDTPLERISAEAMGVLLRHSWPGNVRELENVIQRALAVAAGPALEAADVSFAAFAPGRPAAEPPPELRGGVFIPPGSSLQEAEERLIQDALARSGGNKERAARLLGVSSRTLARRERRQRSPGSGPGEATA